MRPSCGREQRARPRGVSGPDVQGVVLGPLGGNELRRGLCGDRWEALEVREGGASTDLQEGTLTLAYRRQQRLGIGKHARILEQCRSSVRPGVPEAIQLLLDVTQALHVVHERVHDALPPVGLVPVLVGLQTRHVEAFSLSGIDGGSNRLSPRRFFLLDGLLEGLGHFVQKGAELVADPTRDRPERVLAHRSRDFRGRNLALFQVLDRENLVQRPAELTYVPERNAAERLGNSGVQGLASRLCSLANDGDPGLVLRHAYVDDQAPGETRQQAGVQSVDIGRRTVARQHDLTSGRGDLVERAQQHLLRLGLTREELDVVQEQNGQITVTILEPVPVARLQRRLELCEVLLQRHVHDLAIRRRLARLIGDGIENVRLTQA